jgi:predicted acyltransferase
MAAEVVQNRLVSLDVFRGMTIAGMVLVNNPGTWSAIYPPLAHADWHGITPTDYIFPFFLFIVGVAIPIALGKRLEEGVTNKVYLKILTRAALIFFIGLYMAAFPLFDFSKPEIPQFIKIIVMLAQLAILYFWLTGKTREPLLGLAALAAFLAVLYFAGYPLAFTSFETLRIPGVLQRIAVCYLLVSLISHLAQRQGLRSRGHSVDDSGAGDDDLRRADRNVDKIEPERFGKGQRHVFCRVDPARRRLVLEPVFPV